MGTEKINQPIFGALCQDSVRVRSHDADQVDKFHFPVWGI